MTNKKPTLREIIRSIRIGGKNEGKLIVNIEKKYGIKCMTDDQAVKEIEELIHDKVNTAIFAMKSKEAINKVMGSTRLSEEEIREIAFDTIFHDADEESLIWFGDTSTNIAKAICKAQEAQKVKKLTKNDIILLALDAGFKLSTAYGQGTNKLMPVSDSDTLFEFYKKIQKGVKS